MSFQPISSSPDLQDLLQGLMSRIPQAQQPLSIDALTQLFLNLSVSDAPPVPLVPQRFSRLAGGGPVDLREVLMRAEGPAAAPQRAEGPVVSTIGELYDLMKKNHPEACPDDKIIRAALRELFSDSRDSPVTEILDLPNRKEQMAAFLTRYSRRLGDCSLSTITGFFVRAYFAYGPRNVPEPPPLEKFQKIVSARTLDLSLDPKNAVHYRCLMWILESITIEHLLFTRMGELIRTQMAGVAMRKQLLARGCPCSSIPTAPAELCLPIPDYPKDIPWPILFLRCRLARATRTLLEREGDIERFRSLIGKILEAKKEFPAHAAILDQMLLEAQYLECHSKTYQEWPKFHQTLSQLMVDQLEGGMLIEWPAAMSWVVENTKIWAHRFDVLAHECAALAQRSVPLESFQPIANQWDAMVCELAGMYDEAVRMYQDPENRERTQAVFANAYQKMDRHLSTSREAKKKTSLARGISRISEFQLTRNVYSFFGPGHLIILKPERLFTSDLSTYSPTLLFLASEQEKQKFEQASSQEPGDKADFLPPHVRRHRPPPSPPKPRKKEGEKRQPSPPQEQVQAPLEQKISVEAPAPIAADFPISIGEGPGAYQYAWSVSKWTFDDPFVSEESYRERHLPETVQRAIRFEHNFAHVIHKLCFLFGAPFTKRSDDRSTEFVIYALPGEVYWDDGSYQKMIFEIFYNLRTKKVFHAGAKETSPSKVMHRYAEQECFYEEIVEEDMVCEDRPGHPSGLPDDGSRITSFSLDSPDHEPFIEVRDPKYNATCRLYPFPVEQRRL